MSPKFWLLFSYEQQQGVNVEEFTTKEELNKYLETIQDQGSIEYLEVISGFTLTKRIA